MKKILSVCLVFFLLWGCKEKENNLKEKKQFTVQKKQSNEMLYFSGEIRPLREDAVVSPAQATVLKMFFSYGMRVKKGQVLAWLDSPGMQRKYDDALTSFLTAKDTLDVAKAKYVGTEALWAAGLIAKNSYEAEKSGLHTNEIGYIKSKNALSDFLLRAKKMSIDKILELNLADLEKVKAALKEKYNRINLTAPIDGVTLSAPRGTKGPLRVGSQVGEAEVLTLIGDLRGLSIVVKVSEINIDKIKQGMKAKVTGVGFPDMVLDARVDHVNAEAINTTGGAGGLPQFYATIVVPKLTQKQRDIIRIGMSASVEISLNEKDKIMVPIEALMHKEDKTWVTLMKKGSQYEKREIITGKPTSSEVEIVKGLKEGDIIYWETKRDKVL